MPFHEMGLDPREILNDLPGGFFLYEAGAGEKMLYANSETIRIFGCESQAEFMDYVGHSFRGLVHPGDLERVEREIEQQIRASSRNLDAVEYRIIRKDGQVRWIDDFGHLLHNEKWGDVYYVFISDITERKLQEEQAARRARDYALRLDALTGLYTKDFFYECAARAIEQNPGEKYLLVASDIENFRYINESCGTERGDAILKGIAAVNKSNVPGLELGGRIDGDRFVFLFRAADFSTGALMDHVERVCAEFRLPNLSIKFGMYEAVRGLSVQVMCNRALLALDSIKGAYGQPFAVYSENLRKDWIRRQQITASAEVSLKNKQFLVYYQPKHDLRSNRVGGAEALVRWIHPEFGFMNPGLFIPMFEKNGFITKLDLYVLEEVCETLCRRQREGGSVVPVSINLSRRDLDKPGLAEQIIQIVDRFGLSHDLLHFEITESSYTDNPTQTKECVRALHDGGFAIELDDFGSGYSSLAALSSLPIDILKIDGSIIRQDVPGSDRNILEFTVRLAGIMHMQVVQEGVETREQLLRVKALGCEYVQGYFFSKPLPVEEFEDYLSEWA